MLTVAKTTSFFPKGGKQDSTLAPPRTRTLYRETVQQCDIHVGVDSGPRGNSPVDVKCGVWPHERARHRRKAESPSDAGRDRSVSTLSSALLIFVGQTRWTE